jgi:hypothetical protein
MDGTWVKKRFGVVGLLGVGKVYRYSPFILGVIQTFKHMHTGVSVIPLHAYGTSQQGVVVPKYEWMVCWVFH